MDIIDVLRTKIQGDMNKATWEVNRILSDPLQEQGLEQMERWTEDYALAYAKLDMLNRLKAQKDSVAYEEQSNSNNT